MACRSSLLLLVLLAPGPAGTARANAPAAHVATAERVLGLLRGVAGEYREAFDDHGAVVRPIELEEAGLLVAEARDLVPSLGLSADELAPLARAIEARAASDVVDAQVRALAARVSALTGVRAQALPAAVPAAERGAVLFHDNCASCHGEHGRGDGGESARLGLEPANFADVEFMRGETPDDFFNVITLGRRRSGMPAWGEVLSVQDRWDAVRFLWTLAMPATSVTEGQALYQAECSGCHAAGVGDPRGLVEQSDGALFAAIGNRDVGGGVHARLSRLDEADRWRVVAFARTRSFEGIATGEPDTRVSTRRAPDAREALGSVHDLLDAALAARRRGDAAATGLATDAYMRFEPFEKRLGVTDPALVRSLEEGFVRLRQVARAANHVGDAELATIVATLHRGVDEAIAALEPGTDAWVRFVQSTTIILREGFEVVLIVGALVTYVRRSGTPAMVRSLYVGSGLGIVVSIVTAVLLATVLRLTPWAGEALEGGAMLLAAVVLFWVSYWLVSKAEADRWQRYIRGRIQEAVTTSSGTALVAAAFLAVYREGFETILFYQALFASAPSGDVMVPAGLVAGLVLLAVVYVGLERVGLRIPMRAFFLATGGFLYAMAIVFAGRGIVELQEAGLVTLTPVAWAPRVEVLGIFPTVESLAAQGVFVVLLLYAVAVTLRRRAARAGEAAHDPTTVRKVARG